MKTYKEALDYAITCGENVIIFCDKDSEYEDPPYRGPYHVIRAGYAEHYAKNNKWTPLAEVKMVPLVTEYDKL